jgi:F0F1-type ATP synthase gamma subunit
VYHGQFQNIIMQKPAISTIAGHLMSDPDLTPTQPATKSTHQYLFEPSLKEIVAFFETQFTTTLFYQSIHESELARNASRVKAMEESLDNIRHNEKKLKAVQRLLRKREDNKKQLERLASASLW